MSDKPSVYSPIVELHAPYLLFWGYEKSAPNAKTAFGIRDWTPERCAGQWRLDEEAVILGLTDMAPDLAVRKAVQSCGQSNCCKRCRRDISRDRTNGRYDFWIWRCD